MAERRRSAARDALEARIASHQLTGSGSATATAATTPMQSSPAAMPSAAATPPRAAVETSKENGPEYSYGSSGRRRRRRTSTKPAEGAVGGDQRVGAEPGARSEAARWLGNAEDRIDPDSEAAEQRRMRGEQAALNDALARRRQDEERAAELERRQVELLKQDEDDEKRQQAAREAGLAKRKRRESELAKAEAKLRALTALAEAEKMQAEVEAAAATLMQAAVLGHAVRRKSVEMLAELQEHRAATALQAAARGRVGRKSVAALEEQVEAERLAEREQMLAEREAKLEAREQAHLERERAAREAIAHREAELTKAEAKLTALAAAATEAEKHAVVGATAQTPATPQTPVMATQNRAPPTAEDIKHGMDTAHFLRSHAPVAALRAPGGGGASAEEALGLQLASFLESRHKAAERAKDPKPLSADDALLGAQLAHFFCKHNEGFDEEFEDDSGDDMDDLGDDVLGVGELQSKAAGQKGKRKDDRALGLKLARFVVAQYQGWPLPQLDRGEASTPTTTPGPTPSYAIMVRTLSGNVVPAERLHSWNLVRANVQQIAHEAVLKRRRQSGGRPDDEDSDDDLNHVANVVSYAVQMEHKRHIASALELQRRSSTGYNSDGEDTAWSSVASQSDYEADEEESLPRRAGCALFGGLDVPLLSKALNEAIAAGVSTALLEEALTKLPEDSRAEFKTRLAPPRKSTPKKASITGGTPRKSPGLRKGSSAIVLPGSLPPETSPRRSVGIVRRASLNKVPEGLPPVLSPMPPLPEAQSTPMASSDGGPRYVPSKVAKLRRPSLDDRLNGRDAGSAVSKLYNWRALRVKAKETGLVGHLESEGWTVMASPRKISSQKSGSGGMAELVAATQATNKAAR